MTSPLKLAVLASSHRAGCDYIAQHYPDARIKYAEATAEATILGVPRRIIVVSVDSVSRLRGERLMGWVEVGYVDVRLVEMAFHRVLG